MNATITCLNNDKQGTSELSEAVNAKTEDMENFECDDIPVNEDSGKENVVTVGDLSEILDVDDVDDETNVHENELSNKTFNYPSQVDKYPSDKLVKCAICDFASARKDIIENHKELLHNWCPQCYSSFNSKNKLKSHIKKNHSDK